MEVGVVLPRHIMDSMPIILTSDALLSDNKTGMQRGGVGLEGLIDLPCIYISWFKIRPVSHY